MDNIKEAAGSRFIGAPSAPTMVPKSQSQLRYKRDRAYQWVSGNGYTNNDKRHLDLQFLLRYPRLIHVDIGLSTNFKTGGSSHPHMKLD
jgi:hypothetical protein